MKEGYLLHVITWENDGDHYQTCSLDGLSKEDVEFYVAILSRFGSRHGARRFAPGFGNTEIQAEDLLAVVKKALDDHPGISPDIKQKYYHEFDIEAENAEDFDEAAIANRAEEIFEALSEVLGTTVEYEDYNRFIRVVEAIEVQYVEYAMRDMTNKFVKKP